MSLRDVSNVTKVPIGALEAIERGDLGHLPGGIFTRGFVRAYASAVGRDPRAAVDDFLGQFEPPAAEERDEMTAPPLETAARSRLPLASAIAVGGVLLLYSGYIASTGTSADFAPASLLPASPAVVSDIRVAAPALELVPPTDIVPWAAARPAPVSKAQRSDSVDAVPIATTQDDPPPAAAPAEAITAGPSPNEPDPGQ